MTKVNLQGKYVPIKGYINYTTTLSKTDPETNQRIGDSHEFSYRMVVDNFNNVYLLPQINDDNDKATFSFTDIVEAASGDKNKINLIKNARNDLIDIYYEDLLGDKWMDYILNNLTNDSTGKTVRIELEEGIKRLLDEDVKLPKHVSSYEDLAKKPEQVAALAASARPLERKQK